MRLVVIADIEGDVGERLTAEDPIAGRFDPAGIDVRVWRDSECLSECSGEAGRRGVERRGGAGHGYRLEEMLVEDRPERLGDPTCLVIGCRERTRRKRPTTSIQKHQAFGQEGEARLRLEGVIDAFERVEQLVQSKPKVRIAP